jgi:hypothetical protein
MIATLEPNRRATRHQRSRRRRSGLRRIEIVIGVIILLAIVFRLALPSALKSYVNRQLARNPNYAGNVEDIDVHLWRGAYEIRNLKILKTDSEVPAPLFEVKRMDLSIEWKEIFHGAIVGEVVLDQPEINFVAGPTEAETQTGKEGNWVQTLESLFPVKINRMEITQGTIHFQNFHSTPPVDIFLNGVTATATNLTNSRDLKEALPAGILARGTTLGEGGVEIQLQLNPMATTPTFEVTAQLTNVNLVALNDFLKAYGKFDVARGTFALYTSFAAADGKYDGYAKVFFEDLDVFAWEKERKKNILQIFWQAIVGGVGAVFRNHPKDTLATKIPFSGTYDSSQVDVWTAVGTLLRNAFISALVPKLDRTITVEEVKIKEEEATPPPATLTPKQ